MTDAQGALEAMLVWQSEGFSDAAKQLHQQALDQFYQKWHQDPLVLDKWFRLRALSPSPDVCDEVQTLLEHPDFSWTNPNRVRSLLGVFAGQNLLAFHRPDGRGYQLLADAVIKLNEINPQVASRLASAFQQSKQLDRPRQHKIREQLKRIAEQAALSKDVQEIIRHHLEPEAS